MRRSLLSCVGVAIALTAGAQVPYNYRKAPQRTSAHPGYRGTSVARQMPPQRTFSPARYRQPASSAARYRQPTFNTMRVQPRITSSFSNRPAMTNAPAWRQNRLGVNNDWRGARPRPNSAFVNRSAINDMGTRPQAGIGSRNDWRESRFGERLRPGASLADRSLGSNALTRPAARQPFSNWVDSNFRERRSSFPNTSRAAAFWSGTRGAVTNNWNGAEFSGRQYSAFRNYHSQWHDSSWWRNHCGDRIVFITVYSQPFPFYFDAGYWYPAWGYYPDSYYPYDGPIYGYDDLPPDQVVANVQTELYNEGYYNGPIDGVLGPDTRAAITDYQADHGLVITSAIDQPTVESLGLI